MMPLFRPDDPRQSQTIRRTNFRDTTQLVAIMRDCDQCRCQAPAVPAYRERFEWRHSPPAHRRRRCTAACTLLKSTLRSWRPHKRTLADDAGPHDEAPTYASSDDMARALPLPATMSTMVPARRIRRAFGPSSASRSQRLPPELIDEARSASRALSSIYGCSYTGLKSPPRRSCIAPLRPGG